MKKIYIGLFVITFSFVSMTLFPEKALAFDDVVVNGVTVSPCTGLGDEVVFETETYTYDMGLYVQAAHNDEIYCKTGLSNAGLFGFDDYTFHYSWPLGGQDGLRIKNNSFSLMWNGTAWTSVGSIVASIDGWNLYDNMYCSHNVLYKGSNGYDVFYSDVDYDPFDYGDIMYYTPETSSPSIPISAKDYTYNITYNITLGTVDMTIRLSTPTLCSIDRTVTGSSVYPFIDCADDFDLYKIESYDYTDSRWIPVDPYSTGVVPPTLHTPDAPEDYCTGIVDMNYNLKDHEDNIVCQADVNPYLEDLIPDKNIIGWTPPTEDWGVWEFMKDVMQVVFDSMDTIWNGVIDIYTAFMAFIIPNPNDFDYYFYTIKENAEDNLPDIDITGIENFADLDPSNMETVNATIMGVNAPVIDYSLFTEIYSGIQPIAIAIFSFGIIYFNINQVNKLLNDQNVT